MKWVCVLAMAGMSVACGAGAASDATAPPAAETPAEAVAAREAFITGAGTLVLPVIAVDGNPVGDGKPGPVAARLRRLYIEQAVASAI